MAVGIMGCLKIGLVSPIILVALSLVDVKWYTQSQRAINISATHRGPEVLECLTEELKAKLRFEVRLCRRRSGWVDFCEDSRSELHTVTYDEVTESYRVVSDRLDDDQEPISIEVPSRPEAVTLVTTVENLPLSFLTREEPEILQHANCYLQIRTIFTCRGNSSRPFAHISRVLTFGLLNTVEERSQWDDFALHSEVEAAH
jgi:hypothetical protein